MDLSKYPLEKLLHVVGGVIPGFVALLIYRTAVPGSFSWFSALGSLGYRTKLGIVLLVALLIGSTINAFVSSFLGGIGGAVGGVTNKPHYAVKVAPWRDPTWRVALSKVLSDPPKDTQLWADWVYEMKRKAVESIPAAERGLALTKLESERLQNQREDWEWARWYEHYHMAVLQPSENDVLFHVQRGLHFNLETASLYALVSLFFVPAMRHWWCTLPACFWVFLLVVFEINGARSVMDKWSTLDRQITHLSGLARKAPSL